MPKLTLTTLGSRYGSVDALNANFDAIEQAFENTLSRDGDQPNFMLGDLDMNGNSLLNVTNINGAPLGDLGTAVSDIQAFNALYLGTKAADPVTDNMGGALQEGALYFNNVVDAMRVYTGSVWVDTGSQVAAIQSVASFNGTGAQTTFTLPTAPAASENVAVYVGGVFQEASTYTIAGTTLTFSEAPPSGTGNVDAIVFNPVAMGDAASVTYTSSGAGAVPTTVQEVLRRTISVKDYGAVGDGSTNDIYAFIAAAATLTDGDSLFIPDGDYVFDFSSYTVASPVYPSQGIIGLANKTGIRVYGSGAKLRITNLNTQTKGGWSIFWLNNCSDITIEGLRFDVRGVTGLTVAAPEPSYPIISAIAAVGTTWRNLTIRNCEFTSYNPLGAAPNPSGNDFNYKQIPVYAGGDSAADVVRGFRFIDNVMRDINTYKIFLLGVGGVEIRGNQFLDIAGLYPCIRNLMHASRGYVISGNYFEGRNPANDDAPNNVVSTDTPAMVWCTNATNKGGGGVSVVGNTFALTGSGGVAIGDCTGAAVVGNTFYDRVSMAAVLTVEDDTKSAIRLNDDTNGTGTYPASHVSVSDNIILGTVTRKGVQVTHALNGSITGNAFDSAAGYGIKAARARRFVISDNVIADVSSLSGAQAAIFVASSGAVLAAGETVSVFNNRIFGTAGTAISTSSFDATKVFINNNYVSGGITERTAGVQDQLKTDFLTFRSAAGTVSGGANDLDWYEEGSWAPVLTFATPGDLSVPGYTRQVGRYERIGRTVKCRMNLYLSGNMTYTTASGNLRVTGLPFPTENTATVANGNAVAMAQGVYGAGLTMLGVSLNPNVSYLEFSLSNISTGALTTATTTHAPSGSRTLIICEFSYTV